MSDTKVEGAEEAVARRVLAAIAAERLLRAERDGRQHQAVAPAAAVLHPVITIGGKFSCHGYLSGRALFPNGNLGIGRSDPACRRQKRMRRKIETRQR